MEKTMYSLLSLETNQIKICSKEIVRIIYLSFKLEIVLGLYILLLSRENCWLYHQQQNINWLLSFVSESW